VHGVLRTRTNFEIERMIDRLATLYRNAVEDAA